MDFANPRKRLEKKTNFKRLALWSGLAALILITLTGLAWMTLASQATRIAAFEKQKHSLKKANDDAGVDQIVGEVELIDKWYRDNVDWIGELNQLSQRMLTADDAIVSYFKGDLGRIGPELLVRGRLTNRDTNTALMTKLSQRPYEVDPRRNIKTTDSTDYRYEFEYLLVPDRAGFNVADEIARRIREESTENLTPSDSPSDSSPAPKSTPEQNQPE